MPNDTRGRMVEAAVTALRRNGVAGMSFTEILADSGAARARSTTTFPAARPSSSPRPRRSTAARSGPGWRSCPPPTHGSWSRTS
ncbi:hypothetical protein [Dactylosporangium cerinum]